jgi:hypothetical protein
MRRPTTDELVEATGLSSVAIADAQPAAIELYSLGGPMTDGGSRLEATVTVTAAVDPERASLHA